MARARPPRGVLALLAGAVSITPGNGLYFSSAQLPPELRRMISLSTLGSRPLSTPRAIASLVPAIRMPSSMLLQILAVWPAPTLPAWKMLAPIFSSRGRARSSWASLPPTMKVSVPAMAPPVPPETGASMKSMPAASAALATFWLVAAAIVELSITSVPLAMLASRLPLPRNRPSTCWLAGSMVMTASAPCTASCALAAPCRPSALILAQASWLRSKVLTLWPALCRLMAMGPPMLPRPMNAICMVLSPGRFRGGKRGGCYGFYSFWRLLDERQSPKMLEISWRCRLAGFGPPGRGLGLGAVGEGGLHPVQPLRPRGVARGLHPEVAGHAAARVQLAHAGRFGRGGVFLGRQAHQQVLALDGQPALAD